MWKGVDVVEMSKWKGVDVVEMSKKCVQKGWKRVKMGENPKMPYPQCARSIKTCCQTTMMPRVSQSMGF